MNRHRGALGALMAVGLLAAGCGGGGIPAIRSAASTLPIETTASTVESEADDPFTLSGLLTLTGTSRNIRAIGMSGCEGINGYSDIAEGAPVIVYDADGKIIAAGAISDSTLQRGSTTFECLFSFIVTDIPGGAGFYQYEISHRGKLTISEDDARGGFASASLGDS